jgi:hypothetical protein
MSWDKFKKMFVVSEDQAFGEGSTDVDATLKGLEKYELSAAEVPPLSLNTDPALLTGQIDFQAMYDNAGIPNTDEVEQLEKFLSGLDAALPQASKFAAAKAFLNAVGKSPADVLTDSGRKIGVVRAIGDSKNADTTGAISERQAQIADLQREVDQHRAAIEGLQRDLESVRQQCQAEETRLQNARAFFGHVGDVKL